LLHYINILSPFFHSFLFCASCFIIDLYNVVSENEKKNAISKILISQPGQDAWLTSSKSFVFPS